MLSSPPTMRPTSVAHDARLLVDLLEHEIGVAALLGHIDIPVDMRGRGLDRVPLDIGVGDALGGEQRELAVLEHDHVARGVDHGDDVRGDVAPALAAADDDRGILACHGDRAGLVGAHHGEAVGAHDARRRLAHRLHEVAGLGVRLLDQVREHLGVGVAREDVAAALELLAQLSEVLDDAVVDDGDAAVAARVRVRVGGRGAAVRRPAGVADAAGGLVIDVRELRFETGDLAHAAEHIDGGLAGPLELERDACGVVSAVLEALESRDEDVLRRIKTGISNDSAHNRSLAVGSGCVAHTHTAPFYRKGRRAYAQIGHYI